MSLSLHSLFSQKKGAVFSFVLLAAVAMLVVGIFSVSGAKFSTTPAQTFTPLWVQGSALNASINVTVSNDASSPAAIAQVDISRPAGVANIECGALLPSGWSCSRISASKVRFDGNTIAAGSSAPFQVNITPPAGSANYTFTMDTAQAAGSGANSTFINVSVDANPPKVDLVNISTSIRNITTTDSFVNAFLNNASAGVNVVFQVTENASDVGNVTLTYNYTLLQDQTPVPVPDRRFAAVTGNISIPMFNLSFGSASLFNATIPTAGFTNGTRVVFSVLANDTAGTGNGNVSNQTSIYGWNFTIDAVAPQFVDVILTNGSQDNATNARGINISKALGSSVEYLVNSTFRLNLTVLVRDDGGAGTMRVEVKNRTGGFMNMDLITGTNASSTQTSWMINAITNVSGGNGNYNITDLIQNFSGNGVYNLTFRATDNVSNQNATYNFSVEIFDSPPRGAVSSNISINSTTILSVGNTTLDSRTLNATAFALRVEIIGYVNNRTTNVSVRAQTGRVFNMSFEGGSGNTSRWNFTIMNGTTSWESNSTANLTEFCNGSNLAGDRTSCSFNFNFTDVMGRYNDTLNLTVYVDSNAPQLSTFASPASLTTNYSGSALINISINDTVGPLQNVSFRIIRSNITAVGGGSEGFYNTTNVNLSTGDLGVADVVPVFNVTNWIPMTLNTGNNSILDNSGYWTFTINLTAQNLSDGNYTIQINATDSAGRSNVSVNLTAVIFDSSIPTNISILSPSTNTFHRVNFTVNLNATERISGLKNVTVRLENGTHNSPWVGVRQAFPSALSSVTNVGETVRFNITAFNITHIGNSMLDNITLNASNGNFTLRLNVTDTAGNQNTSVTINFTIDTVVPFGIRFVYPGNNQNQSTDFTLNVSVTNESNINTVQYRWENGTYVDATSIGANVSNWINMNNDGGVINFNQTFNATFNMTGLNKTDGNYTIAINVTDKAGNSNTSALGNANNSVFVQLLLDQSRPEVVYVGSLSSSQQTDDFVVNMTTKDNRSFINDAGLFNISNINATAFRLENNTFNSSYQNISFATTNLGNVGNSNRTNVTFEFTSVANGNYNIRFWVNDTAGNQNSTVVVSNITLDNVVPGVTVSIVNVSPAVSGGTGFSGTITFNATVQDNLPLNISITNQTTFTTQTASATYGVFYRFENSTHTLNWTSMSTPSFFNTVHNNTGVEHKALFNASNVTTTLADGDYTVRINATDRAGNQNTTQTISITIQNGGTSLRLYNFTFLGGYVTGSDTNQTSPTLLLNTSENATCLYARDDTTKNYFSDMLPQTTSNTMGNNVSRVHSTALGFLPDRAANGYSTYYACKDVGGNFSSPLGAVTLKTFSVDTRNFFNITMGSGGTNKVRGDYFAVGWNSFTLPKTTLLSNTGLPTNYNITNVLSSLGSSTLATANFTVIYAHNGSAWASYRIGGAGNTFTNFTADTPTAAYYLNITVANERLEIN